MVTKVSRITRCVRLPRNVDGRDFVVGDLHGHRSLFEAALGRLGFDPRRDRVLSVGDLIDRGPESLATLSLIEEPWFHAALGNHELMLLNFLGHYPSRIHARKSFTARGGEWIEEAIARQRKTVARLARALAALPLAIHVADEVPFNVMHGDLCPIGSRQDRLFAAETIGMHEADLITSSRENINRASRSELLALQCGAHPVRISPTPLGELPMTYVGHSPVRHVTVHDSYVYIDQGVCARASKGLPHAPPTIIEHRPFAHWLGGVATARAGPARGPIRLRGTHGSLAASPLSA